MAARKITVKEMKHDRFRETVMEAAGRAVDWAVDNWKLLAMGAGGVVLVFVAVSVWRGHVESREKASRILLAEALDMLPARMRPVASATAGEEGDLKAAMASLEAVVEDYGSTEGGELARYYLSLIHLEEGRFDEAIASAEAFVAQAPNHRLVPLALWVQARAYAGRGDAERAISLYGDIAEAEASLLPPGLARLYLAEYLESQDRLAEALEIYRELAEDEEQTWAGTAQRKVDELAPIVEAESGAAAAA